MTWQDFKGEPVDSQPWSAHTYWRISYSYEEGQQLRPAIQVELSGKSWVRPHRKCYHLLNHERGHYLIGCLCALEFLRRLHREDYLSELQVGEVFTRTLKEYLELEVRYDNETQHRLNFAKQEVWDEIILTRLLYFTKIYNPTLGILETVRRK